MPSRCPGRPPTLQRRTRGNRDHHTRGDAVQRRWLFWLLIALFAYAVLSNLSELERVGTILAHGAWPWLLAAVLAEATFYAGNAFLYYRVLALVGVRGRYLGYVPLGVCALFMNATLPTGGTGGVALYADDAARRGESPALATAGALLVHVLNLLSFTPFLTWAIVYLSQQSARSSYHTVTAALYYAFALVQTGLLALALRRPAGMQALLGWIQTSANGVARLLRRHPFLAEGWAERSAAEFAAAAAPLRQRPWQVIALLPMAAGLHALHMVTLGAVFRAFHGPVPVALPVASYVIAFLFLTISITPQGVGFVEEAMAATIYALGLPMAEAAIIPFAYRGLALWLPLGVGFLMLRRLRAFGAARRPRRAAWLVRTTSLLVVAVATLGVLRAILPATPSGTLLTGASGTLPASPLASVLSALVAYGLLVNVRGLLQRRRPAWQAAMAFLGAALACSLALWYDYTAASLIAGTATLLWFQKAAYYAGRESPRFGQAGRALLSGALLTVTLGILGFALLARQYAEPPSLSTALQQTLASLGMTSAAPLTPLTERALQFPIVVRDVALAAGLYALALLVRAVAARRPASAAERRQADGIVRAEGRGPLAHLALFPDKAYSFGPGESLVAYVRQGRVALALGDPVGPEQTAGPTVAAFVARCQARRLLPAFHLVSGDHLETYRRSGLEAMLVGYESSIDLGALEDRPAEDPALQASEQRLALRGHTLWAYPPPLSGEVMDEMEIVSEEWLAARRQAEMRFSVGWFDEAYVRTCPVIVVRDASGQITAFANIVLAPGGSDATLDVLRQRADALPGTLEFLLMAAFRWSAARGARCFSLGLTHPLSSAADSAKAPATRAAARLARHLQALHGFRGLRHLFLRFAPASSPLYLVYPGDEALPEVVDAIIAADLGTRPWAAIVRRLFGGRRHRPPGGRP